MLRRTYPATRERLFRAWTDPRELKKWFAVNDGYTTPLAEVDLRVGGRYRLGLQPPGDEELLVVGGEYREIIRPERIVFTWRWEPSTEHDPFTLVTVEFLARGAVTELILTHEAFLEEAHVKSHQTGWEGCLSQLGTMLARENHNQEEKENG
jgi:uncharacterized protein YndB with AHSA1/START domain